MTNETLYDNVAKEMGYDPFRNFQSDWIFNSMSLSNHVINDNVADFVAFRGIDHAKSAGALHSSCNNICTDIDDYIDWDKVSKNDYAVALAATCEDKYHDDYPFESALRDEVLVMLTVKNANAQNIIVPDDAFDLNKRDEWIMNMARDEKSCIPDKNEIDAHVYMARNAILNSKERLNPTDPDILYKNIRSVLSTVHDEIVDKNMNCDDIVDTMRSKRHVARQIGIDGYNKDVREFINTKMWCDKYGATEKFWPSKASGEYNDLMQFVKNDPDLQTLVDKIESENMVDLTKDDVTEMHNLCYSELFEMDYHNDRDAGFDEYCNKKLDIISRLGKELTPRYEARCDELVNKIDWKNINRNEYVDVMNVCVAGSDNFLGEFVSRFTDSVYQDVLASTTNSTQPILDERGKPDYDKETCRAKDVFSDVLAVKEAIIETRPNPVDNDARKEIVSKTLSDLHDRITKKTHSPVVKHNEDSIDYSNETYSYSDIQALNDEKSCDNFNF